MNVRQAFEVALQHHQAGRLREAEALYRQILAASPDHSGTLQYFGVLAYQVGRGALALELIGRSIVLAPNEARAHYHLAAVYHLLHRYDEAIAIFHRALALQPHFPEACNDLGVTLNAQGYPDQAIGAFRHALALQPNYAAAHFNLGTTLAGAGHADEAIAAYRRALAIQPEYADAEINLGTALIAQGQFDEAIAACHRALRINPEAASAHNTLGNALKDMGRADEAIAAYRRAIALRPDEPDFHWNLALSLLPAGQWQEGWQEYEWRVRRPHLARPDLTAPPWNGEDLSGRTLLIHQEGGFGDVLHFLRYLPMILARGVGRIIFEGGAPILSLLKMQPGIAGTIERGQSLPVHDFHCSLPSLPRIFNTTLPNIPARVPYLTIDREMQSSWRRKLSGAPYQNGTPRPLLVGLNWAGSVQPADRRSRTLHTFAPLVGVPNVTFVSLQKGGEAGQSAAAPPGMRFVDAAAEVEDFSELAALVSCLDAVASVDTAVAHLAGALAIPTSILLPTLPDFRWMHDRADSPWYPTVRLFRQQDAHSWAQPIEQMAAVLKAKAATALSCG